MKSLTRCTVALVAGVAAWATAGAEREARAAGFANTRMGGEEGNVVATNPTSLYYNPAGMAFASGSQLGLYGSLALRSASWTHTATAEPGASPNSQAGNSGTAHLFNAFGGPSIGGSLKIGNLALGLGFFAPFYGRAHWAKDESFAGSKTPLAVDGVQRWFAIDGALTVLYFTGGAAYRLGPVSIGVTANVTSTTLDQTQAKNPTGRGLPDSTAETRIFVDAHTFNASIGAGAMFEVLPHQLWLGASYQSQPGFGKQRLKGVQVTTTSAGSQTFPSYFDQSLPDIIRGGARWRVKSAPIELRLFGDLTRWSKFQYQCLYLQTSPCAVNADGSTAGSGVQQFVQRNWKDTWGGRLGVSYWVHPAVELLIGGGYETGATPDSTLAPDIPDADNVQGTLGARIKLTDSLFLSAEYTHIQYFDRNNTGKSLLNTTATGAPIQTPTAEEDGGGIYKAWIGIITGNLEALF
jgi:long-chain fatty acid transport protein